jgi:hypothetical protein
MVEELAVETSNTARGGEPDDDAGMDAPVGNSPTSTS